MNPERVRWAIMIFEPYETSGLDGVFSILLQKGLDILLNQIVKVIRASFALRHVPMAWRGIKVVFIPKPEKNEHIKAKDFRLINLSSFILKIMERLVVKYLKENSLILHPLELLQYVYREGRSTDIALHHLMRQVETQMEAKGCALGVFLDIEGAFDSTTCKIICEAMERHQTPDEIRDWTQNMLEVRKLIFSHGEVELTGRLTRGCPQEGSSFTLAMELGSE